jgi:hypothetical protein
MKKDSRRRLLGALAFTTAAVLTTSTAAPALALSGGTDTPITAETNVLKVSTGYGTCTGTLIDPQWVLTAASCFSQIPANYASLESGKPRLPAKALFGADAGWPERSGGIAITEIQTYTDPNPEISRDVILAKLDTAALNTPTTPITNTPATTGETLTFTGWGRTKTEWVPKTPKTGTFTITGTTPATTTTTSEYTIEGQNQASLCLGDGGAPGLRNTPNGPEIATIMSRTWAKNCIGSTQTNDGAYTTRLDDLTPWTQQTINNAKKLGVDNNQIVRINPAGDKNTCVTYLARARTADDTAYTSACDPGNQTNPQRFEVIEQGGSVYMLRDWVSRQCLTNTNEKYVIQAKCDDTSAAQKWDFAPAANDSRYIKNVANGKVLDVVGVNLVQANLNTESATQRWTVAKESRAIPAQALNQMNSFVSLQTTQINPARSAIHGTGDLGMTAAISQNSTEADRKASSWKIVPGLADNTCVSLQSVDYTWAYLGMDGSSTRVGIVDKNQATNATWCLRTGAEAGSVNLDALKNPNLSLRHRDGNLWIGSKAGPNTTSAGGDGPNSQLFDIDSAWKIELPWSTNEGGSGTNEANWAIKQRAQQMNFGNPSGEIICNLKDNGCYQAFGTGRFVIWSPNTGAWASDGGIRGIYQRNSFEAGPLGFPTGNEVCGLRSQGCSQNYQGGAIYWGPGEGVGAILNNDILAKYRELGAQDSTFGYPTEDTKCGLAKGGCRQVFKGGYITTSPTAGTNYVRGAIGAAWKDGGFEVGRLGYPTTGEIPTSTGSYQNFEGGTAYWTNSPAKLEIKYK